MSKLVEAQCRARLEGCEAHASWDREQAPPGNPYRANVQALLRELERQKSLVQEWDESFERALGRRLTSVERAQQVSEEAFMASRITICELDQEE